MNEPLSRTIRLIFLGIVVAVVLIVVGAGVGWYVGGGSLRPVISASGEVAPPPSEAGFVLPTPKPTFTALPSPSATGVLTPTQAATLVPTPVDTPVGGYVRFTVQVPLVTLYQGPGNGYPFLGAVNQGTTLLVAGRTPDGSWWLVCCMENQSGWIPLENNNVLVEGDAGAVDVLEVPIRMQGSPVEPISQQPQTSSAQPTIPPAPAAPVVSAPPTQPALPTAFIAPTAAPAPPAAPSFEPSRSLDARLNALGVAIAPADVAPGQPYWRVVEIIWHDESESGGRHSIFVDVLDEQGSRVVGQPITIVWPDGSQQLPMEAKPFPEYGTNFPMYAAGQSYSVRVDGLPSESVHGMGLGDLNQRDWNVHVEYLIKFQRAIR